MKKRAYTTPKKGEESQWNRLCRLRADQQQIRNDISRGELCHKSEVIAGLKQAAEVIQSDLYGTLISKLVSSLSGKKLAPSRCRELCLACVDEIVRSWEKNSLVAKHE